MNSKFKLNDRVEICGLTINNELNGKYGKICKEISNYRYGILLDNTHIGKLVKSQNIKLLQNLNLEISEKVPIFWCLHDDCLTSLEYFTTQQALDIHSSIHE